jgi:hypothetical protein
LTGLKCLYFSNTEKALKTDVILKRDHKITFHLVNAALNHNCAINYKTYDTYAFKANYTKVQTGMKCLHFSNTQKALKTISVFETCQTISFQLLNAKVN